MANENKIEQKKQQEIIYELAFLEQQINYVREQLAAVEKGLEELKSLFSGLDEIKKDKDMLAHLGRGIFIKSKTVSDEIILDVGNKTFVKKTVPETQKTIKEQIEKLEEAKKNLEQALEKLSKEGEKILKEAQI